MRPRAKKQTATTVAEPLPSDVGILDTPEAFLAAHHPANDAYIKSIEHVQREIMGLNHLMRPKQTRIIKSVFSGKTYTEAAHEHSTAPQTVSHICRSDLGSKLLSLLQYHLQLIEGPNIAQRRSMLWRIAVQNEKLEPKTSIQAIESLNKMQHAQYAQDNPDTKAAPAQTTVNVIIDQKILPRGKLD